jgi:flagellar hook-associated protein FlgK
MSAFLGPIHHWLFKKINLVEDREKTVVSAFTQKHGTEVEGLAASNRDKYGAYYDGTSLEELVGEAAIHEFLSIEIAKVETREAALIGALIKKYGDEAKTLLMETAKEHGRAFGAAQTEGADTENATADDVHKAVKNTFLDGMPCDHVVETTENTTTKLVEKHTDCLHLGYWKTAGTDAVTMCEYLGSWINGVVTGLGVNAAHSRGTTIAKGDSHCEDTYTIN